MYAVKWKSLSRVRLCDPMDYIIHGILQARILEWVAFPSPGDLPNPGIEPIAASPGVGQGSLAHTDRQGTGREPGVLIRTG